MSHTKIGNTPPLRRFSRVHVPDERDAKFRLGAAKSTRLSRTWRDDLPPLNQTDTPTCVGHAWAHKLACQPTRQFLNPFGIYELAKFRDEYRGEKYDGTSVRAGASVLRSLGMLAEYRWAKTLDELLYAVLEIGPVVMGTDWYEGMSDPVDHVMSLTGKNEGGHAYLIKQAEVRRKRFRMKNSWGVGWADQGRAFLPYDVLAELLEAEGEACIAIERKPEETMRVAA